MAQRSIADRLMRYVRPTLLRDFAPPPLALAPDLWTLERRLRMPGGPILSNRTTLIRLPSGGLLVVSPPPVEAGGLEPLDALGAVEEVLVSNSFHYLYAADFAARYPRAALRLAPALHARVAGLPGEEIADVTPSAWRPAVEHLVFGPVRGLSEVVVFHRPSGTLVLTDLAFNLVRFESAAQRLLWRLSGVPVGFGPSRTARTLLLRDRPAVAAFLARVLAWPIARIVVAHGEPIEADAAGILRRAFAAYLPA
ncbi:MAG: hypothetical protein SF182_15380 [Deltaproteobacteria bacterium]|nr:hypothetical protein [Deltaproteobacteria bacterium]